MALPVTLVYGHERNLAGWRARHLRDEAPGLWPGGLEKLDQFFSDLQVAEVGKPGRLARHVAQAVKNVRPFRPGAGVAWDENMAWRMAVERPYEQMYSGVVWLADMLRIDPRATSRMLAVLSGFKGLWVYSSAQVEPLLEAFGATGPRISQILFGVDELFYRPVAYPKTPLVVSVGGDRSRDNETLFAALAQVHAKSPLVDIVVVTRSLLEAPDGVRKVPYMTHNELRSLYSQASVVTIATKPNLYVSGTTVALEALSSARPVVLTETPGHDDYFVHGENTLLSTPGDPTAVAENIRYLLENSEVANQMGLAGRARVEQRHTSALLSQGIAKVLG